MTPACKAALEAENERLRLALSEAAKELDWYGEKAEAAMIELKLDCGRAAAKARAALGEP